MQPCAACSGICAVIDKEHLDSDYRVQYSLFLDARGQLRPEIAKKYSKLSSDLALSKAMAAALPNHIPFSNPDGKLTEVREWMKENVHDGWNILILGDQTTMVFARDVDAINFKMAWT